MNTFYSRVGELILGTRLKRISDKFLTDVSNIYKNLRIPFEVSWFPIFYLLNEQKKLSITDIARELEITHSAVSQMITVLDKKGLIKYRDDKYDKRRRFVCFTEKGRKLMSKLPPIWESMQNAMQEIFSEGINSAHILSALDEIEESLARKNLTKRVLQEIDKNNMTNINVEDYKSAYYDSYKNFVLDWLIDNKDMEIAGVDLINNPQKAISELNISILMAKENNLCTGLLVFRECNAHEIKIIFLVVDNHKRNRQISEKLMSEMINRADSRGIQRISINVTRSNSELIKILKNTGFILHSLDEKKDTINNSNNLVMQYKIN